MLNIKKLFTKILTHAPMAVLLYDNETTTVVDTADITLSDDATKYTLLQIFYQDNDGKRCSTMVYSPKNGTMIPLSLFSSAAASATMYYKTKMYVVNGNVLERARQGNGNYGFNGQASNTSNTYPTMVGSGAYIGITSVIGYMINFGILGL